MAITTQKKKKKKKSILISRSLLLSYRPTNQSTTFLSLSLFLSLSYRITICLLDSNPMKNSDLNGDEVHENGGCDDDDVVLGVDGGTTSTVCVCMPLLPLISNQNLPNPLPILARAVAGSSNHNSVGGCRN